MIDPIRIDFDVACTPEHAFDTWMTRIGDWWPSSHSISGLPEIEVVLELLPHFMKAAAQP